VIGSLAIMALFCMRGFYAFTAFARRSLQSGDEEGDTAQNPAKCRDLSRQNGKHVWTSDTKLAILKMSHGNRAF
jgi:hypothetical protein